MRITLTYAIPLILTRQETILIENTSHAYLTACNHVSHTARDKKTINQKTIHNMVYDYLRTSIGLRSQMSESVIRRVLGNYKQIKQTTGSYWGTLDPPNYTSLGYDLVYGRDYSFRDTPTGEKTILSLNTLKGRIKTRMNWSAVTRNGWSKNGEYGCARILRDNNKWYFLLPITRDINLTTLTEYVNLVGVDVGLNFLFTAYDGKNTLFYNGREVKQYRLRAQALRSELQSKNTRPARRRLRAIGSRESSYMRNENHCASKALVNHYAPGTLFILEDLTGIRNVTEKVKRKDRYVQVSWSFLQFRQDVVYKAALRGSFVLLVDPAFTSQRCPVCGRIRKENRDHLLHLYSCDKCGYKTNDDRVAAMNLRELGLAWVNNSALFNKGLGKYPKEARLVLPGED